MVWYSALALPCALLAFGLAHNESVQRRFQVAVPDSIVLTSALHSDSSVRVIIPGFNATSNPFDLRSRWRRITADTLELSSPVVLVPLADTVQLELLAPSGGPNLTVVYSYKTPSGNLAHCSVVGRSFAINMTARLQTQIESVLGARTCRVFGRAP